MSTGGGSLPCMNLISYALGCKPTSNNANHIHLRKVFVICSFQSEGVCSRVRRAQVEISSNLSPGQFLRAERIISSFRSDEIVQLVKFDLLAGDSDYRFDVDAIDELATISRA